MASLFKIKEEEDEAQSSFLNKPSDLPSIEDFIDESDKLMNHSDTDSSMDEKPEHTQFSNLDIDVMGTDHVRHNSESETTPFEMLDSSYTVKFEEPGTSSQISSDLKPKTLKRRKSEEARQEAKNKKEMEEEEREKMQVLVSNFTEDQLDRYEMYRRAAFPKASIKRLVQTISGGSVSQNVVIAMSGIAKVFVGEIVEQALDVMEDYGDSGPLQPKHLREAIRVIKSKGGMPSKKLKKPYYRS